MWRTYASVCIGVRSVASGWGFKTFRPPMMEVKQLLQKGNDGAHLPPGPPGKPFTGNVYDAPTEHEWKTYTDWAKPYGDLVYIKVLRQPIVIVNSLAVAHDLFEKRSSGYSNRMGFDWAFGAMHYRDKWRRHSKMFYQNFHLAAVTAYTSIQEKRTKELLYRLHKSPDNFLQHIRHLAGATIMEATEAVLSAVIPGGFLVDTLPILKYVPEWMPGAGFKTKARIWRQVATQMPVVPFNACKKALVIQPMSEGKATPSVTAWLLESMADLPEADVPQQEETIRNTGAVAYLAGADTDTIQLTALDYHRFILVHPHHGPLSGCATLDEVIGADRLPTFKDRESLPYMNAVCKELQRWRPVAPLGVPHRLMEDDVYNNNFIPRGSVVIGNAWCLNKHASKGDHDETVYGPDTEHFEPERFLRQSARDPSAVFADNTIYLAASSILKVFNISHAKDANGAEIPVHDSFSPGAVPLPKPFQGSIKPRAMTPETFLAARG
ncbi:CyP450 monooxygenase [Gautieria morchelliformis]|nr:CyP450 monooxygenase [Gautieria morchelliformis]